MQTHIISSDNHKGEGRQDQHHTQFRQGYRLFQDGKHFSLSEKKGLAYKNTHEQFWKIVLKIRGILVTFLSLICFGAKAQEMTLAEALTKDVKEVRFLTVDGAKEGHLLDKIGWLPYLQILTVRNMKEFPIGLAELRHLQTLRIENSTFQTMPKAIYAAWYSLFHLTIQAKLTSLPEGFEKIPSIRTLDLSKNQFSELPNAITKLKTLEVVDMPYNEITHIPLDVQYWQEVKVINLRNNRIPVLPKEIGNLPKIENLLLESNSITELPHEIGNLSTLQTLTLDGNLLRKLPASLAQLKSLKTLSIVDNPIEDVEEDVISKTLLEDFHMKGTKINIEKIKNGKLNTNKYCLLIEVVSLNPQKSMVRLRKKIVYFALCKRTLFHRTITKERAGKTNTALNLGKVTDYFKMKNIFPCPKKKDLPTKILVSNFGR